MWLGKAKHFPRFPGASGRIHQLCRLRSGPSGDEGILVGARRSDVLRAEFAGWDPRIAEVLSKVQSVFRWALYDREPLPTWTKGRLSLLGDAAHPMLPHLGQGANQSIEDGMALATILSRATNATAPAALLAYERLRRERVAAVQRGARESGLRYDSAYADLGVRDAEITAHAEFRKRLYGYDVVPEAQAAATGVN